MEYDLLGRRTKLIDPNAGTILYEYDGWGNLKKQTDARGEVEEYTYEDNGRLQSYKRGTEVFSYAYDPTYKGQVSSIAYGGVKTDFRYGTYGRLASKTETVDNRSFQFSYVYNGKGQLETTTYPNSKSIKYEYANGDLYKIIWQPDQTTVWQKNDENAKGQVLTTTLGNGVQGTYAYNTIGVSTSIKAAKGTASLLNISYQNIDARGNIKNRNEQTTSQSENFTYDSMNRLTTGVEYGENGNILFKADAGTYQYEDSHPHAISSLSPTSNDVLPKLDLSVTYNSVRLPVQLSEGNKVYMLTYNGENSRVKSQFVQNGSTVFTKYYCGPYEEILKGGTTRKNYYIYGGGQIVAVYTEGASDAGMYYFHNDHLGSPWLITNASGNEVQRLNFNAWGLRRDATNWDNYSDLPEMKFDRGFTGHEHLEMFGLINMNARLYDPLLGRFLSPDPIIQVPEFTQSYNGYSYALNNPLSYTDPNGEFLFTALIPGVGVFLDAMLVGAAVGAVGGGVKSVLQGQNFWGGAWKGAITGGVGGLMGPIGGAGMSFAANVGLGAAQGTLVGALDAALWGTNMGKGMLWGCISGASFAALTSDNMKNMVKGKGFKSNQGVFKDFAAGKYTAEGGVWQQDALDYFGFEGEYNSKIKLPEYVMDNSDFYGAANPITGNITYGNGAFDSFDKLKATYYKEMFHRKRILSNIEPEKQMYDNAFFPEERLGFINQYQNSGLYPRSPINSMSQINYYQFGILDMPVSQYYQKEWWHFVYKTPRRW
ncbi:RHS repeat domain-containing protein [Parabacteroides johnsonii]|uniref:RHS repeat domain-containing protein n=1 Tax=Parabacteroides johnsonii TaxID=387661 RepID=UPI00265CF9C8|nr:RHS repeat-associated core domain-containing protein [Parabacteroides johnsonii]